jgi:hypothetical protein
LFCVETTAKFMAFPGGDVQFVAEAAGDGTVFDALRDSVVSRGKDTLVHDSDSPHSTTGTGRALGYQMGNTHEIIRPRETGHTKFLDLSRRNGTDLI